MTRSHTHCVEADREALCDLAKMPERLPVTLNGDEVNLRSFMMSDTKLKTSHLA